MAGHGLPHYQNDAGHESIEIGVREFMCVGAKPPFDHPHEFLDMGDDVEKVCPYCSTLFRYEPAPEVGRDAARGLRLSRAGRLRSTCRTS